MRRCPHGAAETLIHLDPRDRKSRLALNSPKYTEVRNDVVQEKSAQRNLTSGRS